jgi:hypothetical protein
VRRFAFRRTHCDFRISAKRADTVLKPPAFFGQADGLQKAKLCVNTPPSKAQFSVERLPSSGLTEDELHLLRDERTQSVVAARVAGRGHGACGRWSQRLLSPGRIKP